MSVQIELGKKGEELAKDFLKGLGYVILEQNWRYSKAEIDLIAKEGECLIFVEVKTRSYDYYGPPEDFVNAKKKRLMVKAASAYMHKTNHDWEIRFDVISIILSKNKTPKINHFKDAFFPGL